VFGSAHEMAEKYLEDADALWREVGNVSHGSYSCGSDNVST